ncbi:MAG: hypothetical protein ACOYOV_03875 [Bacteroidales bacterium]
MIKGNIRADDPKKGNQKTDKSYIHFMAEPDESAEDAIIRADNHIKEFENSFENDNDENKAYIDLGEAYHTLMDKTCPVHFKKDKNKKIRPRTNNIGVMGKDNPNWVFKAGLHLLGELIITPWQISKNVNILRNEYRNNKSQREGDTSCKNSRYL